MFKNRTVLMAMLVLMSSLLLTACVTLKEEDVSDNETAVTEEGTSDKDEGDKKPGNEKYADAPFYELNLTLPDKDGVDIDLNQYTGKTLLFVNFFATWCPPCNEELPDFEEYAKTYEDALEIVLVDLNHSSREGSVADVMEWYKQGGYTMPILFDMDGKQTKSYLPYIQGIPTTFIYNEDGLLLEYVPAMLTKESLDMIINKYANN